MFILYFESAYYSYQACYYCASDCNNTWKNLAHLWLYGVTWVFLGKISFYIHSLESHHNILRFTLSRSLKSRQLWIFAVKWLLDLIYDICVQPHMVSEEPEKAYKPQTDCISSEINQEGNSNEKIGHIKSFMKHFLSLHLVSLFT